MANPEAVDPHMPAAMLGRRRRRHAIDLANRRRRRRRRRRRVRDQLIANAAVFLVSTAGSIVIYYGAANPSGGGGSRTGDEPAYALLAFLLSLLGIWLILLALVADRFPAAAATLGEAIAMPLRAWLLRRRR